MKKYQDKNVYEAAKERIKFVFENFEKVYVSFSGGKDSSVVLNLALDYMREHREKRKLGILFLDLEGQYSATINFIREILLDNAEYLDVYWVCLPLNLRNSVSVFQPFWTCWDIDNRDKWVREYPDFPGVITEKNNPFPFFRKQMEFEEFVPEFGKWYSNGKKTACLVGIRSDESLNRYRTIKNRIKGKMCGKNWTTKISGEFYNVYPIYDWNVRDVWIGNAKLGWKYNPLYDQFYKAGVPLASQRICQPYGDDQRIGLNLYRVIEPATWAKVVNRVSGANFGNIYCGNRILGYRKVKLPKGHTWKSYCKMQRCKYNHGGENQPRRAEQKRVFTLVGVAPGHREKKSQQNHKVNGAGQTAQGHPAPYCLIQKQSQLQNRLAEKQERYHRLPKNGEGRKCTHFAAPPSGQNTIC